MNSKTHRKNHNFQIAHFLVGSCHTADAAYALLCDLREERQAAVDNYHVVKLRNEAKEIEASRLLESKDEADRKLAAADLMELDNARTSSKVLFDAAKDELEFIDECIAKIQPLRKFAHLSDPESHEACQHEEWKFELIERAENSLLMTGTIPPSEFATMRMHPAFQTEILPRINEVNVLLKSSEGMEQLQTSLNKPKLLEAAFKE